MNRRGFLTGIIAAGVAPAVIRTPGLLMPIKPLLTVYDEIAEEWAINQGSLYDELTSIVRRAFVPRMVVDLYWSDPILTRLSKPA